MFRRIYFRLHQKVSRCISVTRSYQLTLTEMWSTCQFSDWWTTPPAVSPPPPRTALQGGLPSTAPQVWESVDAPSTLFIVFGLHFLISIASFIQRWYRLFSCLMTLALSQSMIWFSLLQWSVMADLRFSCLALSFIARLSELPPFHIPFYVLSFVW